MQPSKPSQAKMASYTVRSAMAALQEKVALIRPSDLAVDLLPMFESRLFIESWLEGFHANFATFARFYLSTGDLQKQV